MNTKRILSFPGIICLLLISSLANAQTYSMPGGSVSACSGNFYDTGGSAGSYNNNQDITTVFCPSTAGSYLSFAFSSLNLHLEYDFLYIYDGNSTSAPLIGVYTGTANPGTITASSLNASGCITFRFTSNGWTTASGWAAGISCSATPGAPRIGAHNGSYSMCSGSFTDAGGATSVYLSNSDVVTTICPSAAGQYASVTFTSMSLESNYDWLYVYDGSSTSAPLIGMYTGSALPGLASTPGVITASANSPSGCLTFRFTCDTWNNYSGWQSTVSCTSTPATPSYSIAPGTVTTCSAGFTDMGGSTNNYSGLQDITNTYCPAVAGQAVSAVFTSLALEAHYDHLYIYDGNSTASPLVGIYTSNFNPGTITASTYNASGCLTFRFISDTWNTDAGWVANMSCAAPSAPSFAMGNQTVNVCSAFFTDDGGATGNYYYNRASALTKTQTFCPVNAGDCVRASFSSFDTEGSIDYLRVYDGNSLTAPLVGSYYGAASPGVVNATTANTSGCLTFEFTSSGWNSTAGWLASISCNCTGLPVDMLSFTGEWINDNDALLQWTTATETNNDHFIIERSTNGVDFEQLDKVDGHGTLSIASTYSFVDEHSLEGISYYRLMQVDHDGKYKYSQIISMERLASDEIIIGELRPNPSAGEIFFTVRAGEEAQLQMKIVNELGVAVDEKLLSVAKGENEFNLSLMQLSPGVYHLLIRNPENGSLTIQKLIKI